MLVRKNKLYRMEALAFRNGLRLHFDAINLFFLKSYPSAYFLSILSLEEFGKAEALSHFLFYWAESPLSDKDVQEWFAELYKHPFKQHAFYRGRLPLFSIKRLDNALKKVGMLELLKQNSVYVGLPKQKKVVNLKGKINNPFKVNKLKAEQQITIINDYLVELALGQIHKHEGVDNPVIENILNRTFLTKLESKWEKKSWDLKLKIKRIEKWVAGKR